MIRPAERRRDFKQREAQRYLEHKERPRWALIAYGIVLLAVLIIGSITYTTYAFSKYRNEILPGVYVDRAYVGELTGTKALDVILTALQPVYDHPVRLTYPGHEWQPTNKTIGYAIYPQLTVQRAQAVGRTESFAEQLLDRLPIHPDHAVALAYHLDPKVLRAYMVNVINPHVVKGMSNAGLARQGSHFKLVPSAPGERLNITGAVSGVRNILGTLSTPSLTLPVMHIAPAVGNDVARQYLARVEGFLNHPPVYSLGKRVTMMSRADLAPMISFQTLVDAHHREIRMTVDSNAVNAWVTGLAGRFDRTPQDPKLDFGDSKITTLAPSRNGRALDQAAATAKLLAAISGLHPRARLQFQVSITHPPLDQTNPASLGISSLMGQGYTSFVGAGDGRYTEIKNVTDALNKTLISPGQDISFNQLVRFGWNPGYYADGETSAAGQLVPADHGGMQQVATTFFRALYAGGLERHERYSHAYDLSWYDNPPGLDAIVSPNGKDVTFHNNTGHYLFITTRVEPVRQEVFVYLWGPKLGWQVKILPPNLAGHEKHPPKKYVQDSALSPGDQHQLAWAHDGFTTSITRTIVFPGGKVKSDTLTTHYKPWGAVVQVGVYPTATPTPKKHKKSAATTIAIPTPTGPAQTPTALSTPGATPTATFNH